MPASLIVSHSEPRGLVHDLAAVAGGDADAALRRAASSSGSGRRRRPRSCRPSAAGRPARGRRACCGSARRRRSGARLRHRAVQVAPSAHVSQPLTAYQTPPTKTALLSPVDVAVGERLGHVAGRCEAGDWADPILAGPSSDGRGADPVRKRRMLPTSVARLPALGAPASSAQGCGSPKIAPRRSGARRRSRASTSRARSIRAAGALRSRAPAARSRRGEGPSPRRSASSASRG